MPVVAHTWSPDRVYLTLRGFEDPESGIHSYDVSLIGVDGWPIALKRRFHQGKFIQFPVVLEHEQSFTVHVRALSNAGVPVS